MLVIWLKLLSCSSTLISGGQVVSFQEAEVVFVSVYLPVLVDTPCVLKTAK